VFRVQGTELTVAFDGSCAGLGARAAGTPNCSLFGAAEPQRTNIPTPSRFPKPRP